MEPGELNRLVAIRALSRVDDAGGGYTETPTTVATVWMKMEPLQGDEQLQAMQTGMRAPHRFTARYRADITGATELLYDSRRFDVNSVTDPDAKHRELVILADEIRAGT